MPKKKKEKKSSLRSQINNLMMNFKVLEKIRTS
jgi:hypothetical protein